MHPPVNGDFLFGSAVRNQQRRERAHGMLHLVWKFPSLLMVFSRNFPIFDHRWKRPVAVFSFSLSVRWLLHLEIKGLRCWRVLWFDNLFAFVAQKWYKHSLIFVPLFLSLLQSLRGKVLLNTILHNKVISGKLHQEKSFLHPVYFLVSQQKTNAVAII